MVTHPTVHVDKLLHVHEQKLEEFHELRDRRWKSQVKYA
jgi:hypothetical protein